MRSNLPKKRLAKSSLARSRRKLLTRDRLKEVLVYFPTTGRFRWRVRQGLMSPGREAGTASPEGYHSIQVDGVRYLSHRLAWLYVYGEHPTGEIDHLNRKRTDNRIVNLDQRPHPQNMWNASTRNPSGFTGVYRQGAKWKAEITTNGKKYYLGSYDTKDQAAAAYRCAARLLRARFTRNSRASLMCRSNGQSVIRTPNRGPRPHEAAGRRRDRHQAPRA